MRGVQAAARSWCGIAAVALASCVSRVGYEPVPRPPIAFTSPSDGAVVGVYTVFRGVCTGVSPVSIVLPSDVSGPSAVDCFNEEFVFVTTTGGSERDLAVSVHQTLADELVSDEVMVHFVTAGFNSMMGAGTLSGSFWALAFAPATGDLIVGGSGVTMGGTPRAPLVRVSANGSVDPTFPAGLVYDVSSYVAAVEVDEAGRIYVGGRGLRTPAGGGRYLIRLLPDGQLDGSFSAGGFNDTVNELAHDPTIQTLYAAGYFTRAPGGNAELMVRLREDGTRDTAFDVGTGFDADVTSIAVHESGVLVVGNFRAYQGSPQYHAVKLTRDGSPDPRFFSPMAPRNGLTSVAVSRADGTIFLGGEWSSLAATAGNCQLVRTTSTGQLRTDYDITVDFDGGLSQILRLEARDAFVVAGNFLSYGGVAAGAILALRPDGQVDTSFGFGEGFDETAHALAHDPHRDRLALIGRFAAYNGIAVGPVVLLTTDGSLLP